MHTTYRIGIVIIIIGIVIVSLLFTTRPTPDYRDSTYTIDGQSISLIDGYAEHKAAPGSAANIVTRAIEPMINHDLNDDGQEDVIFLLTQEQGGSGTFYYVVAALHSPTGYIGSHAFLIGDRITPQSLSIDEGVTTNGTTRKNVIVITYMTRDADQPFTTPPTITKSVWVKLDPTTMQFGEVMQNFEGEGR